MTSMAARLLSISHIGRGGHTGILCEHVSYLHSISYCDAGPDCLSRTVCKYSMLLHIMDIIIILIIFAQLFFRDCSADSSFTSGKLYICLSRGLRMILTLHQFDRDFVSRARCLGLNLLCSFWYHDISNVATYGLLTLESVDWFACCICYCLALFRHKAG